MPNSSRGYSKVLSNRGFVFLLAAQALAVFDDNTFKQILAFFILAHVSAKADQNLFISLATALFVLPYIVFSSYAGQVASSPPFRFDNASLRHSLSKCKRKLDRVVMTNAN